MSELDGRGLQGRSEATRTRRLSVAYRSSTAICLCMACALSMASSPSGAGQALPNGGQYVAGQGTIQGSGNGLTVNQSTSHGIINWQNFSIGAGNSVFFNNGSGATLNRVTGGNLSQIDGSLKATGSVYLINPQGIVIGPGGQVMTNGSFVASTRDVSSSAFMSGDAFAAGGTSNGSVVNQGVITSSTGDAILVGQSVTNTGTISAPNGTVGLAAGNQILLQPMGSNSRIAISGGNGSVTNNGNIAAAQAELNSAGGNVYALVENNRGLVTATGTKAVGGHIWLTAGGTATVTGTLSAANGNGSGGAVTVRGNDIQMSGTVNASATAAGQAGGSVSVVATNSTAVSGTIDASGLNARGGSVETSGHLLSIDGAKISAGTGGSWLLDPYDLTVTSSAASTIDTSLNAGTSVTLKTTASGTSGPGTANSAGNGDIFIDSAINWNTSATLTLDAYRSINILAPVTVSGAGGVVLKTNDGGSGGDYGFGFGNNGFAGSIDFTGTPGAGQSLTINGTAYTLLYSMSDLQNINSNLGGNYALANSLNAASTTGWTPLGGGSFAAFAGRFDGLGNTISNLTINSNNEYLGLFGNSSGTVRDIATIGGTIGGASLESDFVGGLIGSNTGTIEYAYSSENISGSQYVGGLVGSNAGSISNAFATGSASGFSFQIGGLVGDNGGTIANTFATGAVFGSQAGGLVGANFSSISNSYSTGPVSGSSFGGLVGVAPIGTITNSYWDTQTSGVTTSAGGSGETTAQLQGSLPTGFGTTVWGTGAGLFPYFLSEFPSGAPVSISGFAYSDGGTTLLTSSAQSEKYVYVLANGNSLGSASTGANGYFYFLIAPSAISASGSAVVAYTTGATGGALLESAANLPSILDIFGNTLVAPTTATTYSALGGTSLQSQDASLIAQAVGSNSSVQSFINGLTNYGYIVTGGSFTFDTSASLSGSLLVETTASNAGIAVNAPLSAQAIDLISAGTITQNSAGIITASSLSGSSAGTATLAANNAISNLGPFTTGNSALSLHDTIPLTVDGAINVGSGTLTLTSSSSIGSNSAGIITAANLTGSSVGSTSLAANNAITNLEAFTTGNGSFSLTNAGALTLTGALNAGTGNVTISVGGALTESGAGLITANAFGGSSAGTATLSANNAFANLSGYSTTNGGVTIYDMETLTISGPVSIGGGNDGVLNVIGSGHNLVVDAALSGAIVDLFSPGSITVEAPLSFGNVGVGLFATGAVFVDAPIVFTNGGGILFQTGTDTTTAPGHSLAELYFGAGGYVSFGSSDSGGELAINGVAYNLIYNLSEVQQSASIASNLSLDYALATSVDGTSINWAPIGTNGAGSLIAAGGFSGIFEGLGNTISNLTVNTGTANYAGLFGYSSGTLRDVILSGGSVTGGKYVGGLVGYQSGGVTANVVVSVPVFGNSDIGGVAGYNAGAIAQSFSLGAVSGTGTSSDAGGLVGVNNGEIVDDYAWGSVAATSLAGGLAGANSGSIASSYSTGMVSGTNDGLVASNQGGSVTNSYWDTQTSGVSSSAAGTGLTTAQLQGTLPSGFSNAIWGTGTGLFPYLLWEYPLATPIAVTGTAYNAFGGTPVAGEQLSVEDNGIPLLSLVTGANGSFYTLLSPGGDVVIYGSGSVGAAFLDNVSASLTGVAVYGNTLNAITNSTQLSTVISDLNTALGTSNSTTPIQIQFDTYGTFVLNARASNFTIDSNLYAPTFDLIAAGSVTGSINCCVGGYISPNETVTLMGSSGGAVNIAAGTYGAQYTKLNIAEFVTNNNAFSLDAKSGTISVDPQFATVTVTGAINTGTGNLTITDAGPEGTSDNSALIIDAPINGGIVTLSATGNITQNSAGIITASTLTGNTFGPIAGESATFSANNAIANLGAFTATAGFTLNDATPLSVTGAINAGTNNLTLTTTGANNGLSINAPITGGTVDLVSAGALTQNSAGIITATTLTGSTNGSATLADANAITSLGAFATNNGALSLTDAAALTATGSVNTGTGNLTLTTTGAINSLSIDAPTTGATVDLVSAGTLTQNGAGIITATTLTGSTNRSATLSDANAIANLGAFTTNNGAFSLTDAAALTVTGLVNTGTGGLSLTTTGVGSNFTIGAPMMTGATANLVSAGTLSESGNATITATTLTGSSSGAAALSNANNIVILGSFATGNGSFALTTSGNLMVDGAVNVGTSYALLNAGGTLGESGAGAITGQAFAGTSQGDATLNGANAITYLAGFTTGNGALSFTDTQNLQVTAALNAGTGNVTLTTTNGSTLGLSQPVNGATVDLVSASTISQDSAGIITATTLTGSSANNVYLNQAANAVANLGSFTTGNSGFVLTTAGNLTLDGVLNVGSSYGVIDAGGTLGESGAGAIAGQAFGGSSQGAATLNGANAITYLAGFTTTNGALSFTDTQNLQVTAALNAGTGNVTLTTTNGSTLGLYAPVSGATVDLVSAGYTEQGGNGIITATTLTGSSVDDVYFNQAANAVTNLGSFTTSNSGFALTTSGNLNLDGVLNVGSSYVVLYAGGTLSESGAGAITGQAFAGTSQGTATLNGANAITYLAGFTTGNGALSFTDAQNLQVTAALNAGTGNVTLTTTNGSTLGLSQPVNGATVDLVSASTISQNSAGIITATTLTGSSANNVYLNQAANAVANLGSFTTGNSGFVLTTAGNLTLDGVLNVGSSYGVIDAGGTLGESGAGAISGQAFAGTSQGAATLNGANAITYLAGFTTTNGALSFTGTQNLQVTAALNAGTGNVTLTTTNGSTLGLYAPVSGATVDLVSAGYTEQGGNGIITATTLTGSSVDDVYLNQAANAVADLGSFTTSNGGFALTTAGNLTLDGVLNVGSSYGVIYAGGTLGESGAGGITGQAFAGTSQGTATLNGANAIAYLAGFTTGNGALSFTDTQNLQVTAALNAGTGNVTLTTTTGSNIGLYAPVSGATVDLVSAGTISQNGAGIIAATTLTGSSSGNVTLNASGNTITNLGDFSTNNGNFDLTNSIALDQTGTLSTGTGTVDIVDP